MTINYTTEPIKPKQTYPWVGIATFSNDYTIVLFTKHNCGFCLDSTDKSNKEDRKSNDWDEDNFIPCSITLSSL